MHLLAADLERWQQITNLPALSRNCCKQWNFSPFWFRSVQTNSGRVSESHFKIFFSPSSAARGLVGPVQHDASTAVSTTMPGSPAASPRAHLTQEPQLKEGAQMNFSLRVLNGKIDFFFLSPCLELDCAVVKALHVVAWKGKCLDRWSQSFKSWWETWCYSGWTVAGTVELLGYYNWELAGEAMMEPLKQ